MVCLLLQTGYKRRFPVDKCKDRKDRRNCYRSMRSDQLLVVFLAYFYISRVAAILTMDLTFMSQLSCFLYLFFLLLIQSCDPGL